MPSTISAGTTAGTAIAIAGDTTGNLAFQTNGTTTAMTIDTSQNVGIGTTSPQTKFHVLSSAFTPIINQSTNTEAYLQLTNSGGTAYVGSKGNDLQILVNPAGNEAGIFTSTGLFRFNSGYGSVATAYGCRVWVNFNGTGTPAIRASGGASSITDHGTGQYTVNFSITFPDANYVATGTTNDNGTTNNYNVLLCTAGTPATTSCRLITAKTDSNSFYDPLYVYMTFVR